MAYKVVRPFAYGADGIHAVELVVGDERDDFGGSTAGLLAEKYIEPAEVQFVAADADTVAETVEAETEADADGAQVDNGSVNAVGEPAGSKAPRSRRRLRG